VQSDPDLPTGRALVRGAGHSEQPQMHRPAAFDNLQWDFDLTDLAQQADVVVYGTAICDSGQTRSVILQFLGACPTALRMVDVTSRPRGALDRAQVGPLLDGADVALLDRAALAAVTPGPRDEPAAEAAQRLLRQRSLSLALLVEPRHDSLELAALDRGRRWSMEGACAPEALTIASLGFLLGIASGGDVPSSLSFAHRVADFARQRPGEPVPEELV
jgi:sugar/nucleoside kinase (ribokinase family)